jgi:hypothetical protein
MSFHSIAVQSSALASQFSFPLSAFQIFFPLAPHSKFIIQHSKFILLFSPMLLLITGAAGFIGSEGCIHFASLPRHFFLLVVDQHAIIHP